VPTYSYRCTECGTAFDIHQAFSDATLTVCPTCGGVLRKVFSPIGVSFTGSGFYRNDSRAKPASDKPVAEKGAAKAGTEKSTSTTTAEKAAPAKEKAASTPRTTGGTGKAAASNAAS